MRCRAPGRRRSLPACPLSVPASRPFPGWIRTPNRSRGANPAGTALSADAVGDLSVPLGNGRNPNGRRNRHLEETLRIHRNEIRDGVRRARDPPRGEYRVGVPAGSLSPRRKSEQECSVLVGAERHCLTMAGQSNGVAVRRCSRLCASRSGTWRAPVSKACGHGRFAASSRRCAGRGRGGAVWMLAL